MDLFVKNVDVELLRKQYEYYCGFYGAQAIDREMNEGLLNLLEAMLEVADKHKGCSCEGTEYEATCPNIERG